MNPSSNERDFSPQIDALKARLELENRIKDGAENMLQVEGTMP
jgi:hypothetical protein